MLKKFIVGLIFAACAVPAIAGQDLLIPLAAYTTSQTSPLQYKKTEQDIHVIINITSAPSSGTLTPTIYAKDVLGNSYALLVGTALSSTGITVLKVGRGITPVTNQAVSDYLPDVYYLQVVASTSNSATYSVTINRGQ